MSSSNATFKYIDLFAGIGGFRIALDQIGGRCVAHSEIEKNALVVYNNNYDTSQEPNLGDITKVHELPQHDLLVGGVPCQSWSIAGKNKGINDKRGQLWNDVIRLVDKEKPKAFVFENVKGLTDPRHVNLLNSILESFKSSGYVVQYKLLNSYDYGVPQNRVRIFIVGLRSDLILNEFSWPTTTDNHLKLFELLDGLEAPIDDMTVDIVQRNLFGDRINVGFNKLVSKDQRNPFFILTDIRNGPTSVHSWDFKDTTNREKEICMIILKNRRKPQYGPCDGNPMSFADLCELVPDLKVAELQILIDKKILRQYDDDGRYEFYSRRLSGGIDGVYRIFMPESTFFPTMTATGTKDVIATKSISAKTSEEYKSRFITEILSKQQYRQITAEEAVMFQGFPVKFKPHSSSTQTKRLIGNAVSPPVVRALGNEIIKTGIYDMVKCS